MNKLKTLFPYIFLIIFPFHILIVETELDNPTSTFIGFFIGISIIFPSFYFRIKDSDDENKEIKLKTFSRMLLGILFVINASILLLEFTNFNSLKLASIGFILIMIILNNANMILKSFNDDKVSIYLEDEEVFQKTNRQVSKLIVTGGFIAIMAIALLPIEKWYLFFYMAYFFAVQLYGYFYAKRLYFQKFQ